MEHPEVQNIAETMRQTVEQLSKAEPIDTNADRTDLSAAHLLSLPKGRTVADVTEQMRKAATHLKPAQKTGTAKFETLDSFIDWTNRFKGDESVVFANQSRQQPSLTSVIDYHPESAPQLDPKTGDANARYCRHRGLYKFPVSEEWKIWNAVAQKTLAKSELGEFIEEHAKDIIDPSPALLGSGKPENAEPWEKPLIEVAAKLKGRYGQFARLMEMSRHLEIYVSSNLITKRNPDDGTVQMSFENENKDAEGKPLSIPNLFLIAIPVFDQGVNYRLPVRFSFKKNGSAVSFRLTIYNPEAAFYDALKEAVNTAQEKTKLPTFYGSPETP
ncbi:DUF2303 family protein [Parasedimentitalea psychrophila]|uniref:DUF2303 family protein n=1 Tax=Parasedimentitalea psychrophila TaxID=2997337 RepID=A0A9Y2P110_9RHOB|nr:DUF2303 family protein [Parasedimentitalea psychrophila]WIY25141.1 DUF2303 family protein [Parasedimentitalea psychrophila]